MNSLNELVAIAPPPQNPIDTGRGQDITVAENEIGIQLPSDYIEYIRIYGNCLWYQHLFLYSPFSSEKFLSLWERHKYNIEQMKIMCKYLPPPTPYAVFPEPRGIFLCGGDIYGEFLAWITEGSPQEWPIVYFNVDGGIFEKFNMNITTFLLKLVKGEIKPALFPDDIRHNHNNRSIATSNIALTPHIAIPSKTPIEFSEVTIGAIME